MKVKLWLFLLVVLPVAIAAFIGVPLLIIWALNTLFPTLNIDYTLSTWFAVVVLSSTLFVSSKTTIRKE